MKDISVIIVNYNVKHLLENCINSIFKSSKGLDTEIIIYDNNSYDGSADYIESKYNSQVKLIRSDKNLGFAKANNIASSYASGKYILILNPDTVLQENTLKNTLDFYNTHNNAGIISCKLILPNGKLDLACRRSFPTPSVALSRILGLSYFFPKNKYFGKYNLTYLDENKSYEVESVCGAFMFINKEIFDKVNGFDDEYFMYGEDLDLCYRIKKAGYKNYYFAETSTIHFKGESTRKSSITYVNNFYGAMMIFVRKNLKSNFPFFKFLLKTSIYYRAFLSYTKRFFKSFYPVILDIALIIAAMLLSIKLRFEEFPIEAYSFVIAFYSIVWILCLAINGTYRSSVKLNLFKPLNGILVGFFINSSFTYFFNEYAFSRVVVLRTAATSLLFLIIWRLFARTIKFFKQKDIFYNENNTLIIGKNEESERFVNKLRKRIDTNYNILGYISTGVSSVDYIGNLNNLKDITVAMKIKNIIFAKNALSNREIFDLMWQLQKFNINFKILSHDSDIILGKSALDKIDDLYLLQIEYNISKKFNIFTKRSFDMLAGIVILVTVYPFVRLFSYSKNIKLTDDKFLGKILFIPKVIKGELSIVGRPWWDATGTKEYLGKKGLTGLVQLNYYKKLTPDEVEYYNYYYAKNQNLAFDIEIIIKTLSLYIFRNKFPLI